MKIVFILIITIICGNSVFTRTVQQPSSTTNEPIPIYAPERCPGNQLLYPINQDWICDCAPGHLYYKPKDDCFAIYRQGPCNQHQHLILNQKQRLAECVNNPCQDGYARYKGRCYELGKPDGPCRPVHEGGGIFNVNLTTLNVECIQGSDPLSIFKTQPICPPGTRRDTQNICRENYNV